MISKKYHCTGMQTTGYFLCIAVVSFIFCTFVQPITEFGWRSPSSAHGISRSSAQVADCSCYRQKLRISHGSSRSPKKNPCSCIAIEVTSCCRCIHRSCCWISMSRGGHLKLLFTNLIMFFSQPAASSAAVPHCTDWHWHLMLSPMITHQLSDSSTPLKCFA